MAVDGREYGRRDNGRTDRLNIVHVAPPGRYDPAVERGRFPCDPLPRPACRREGAPEPDRRARAAGRGDASGWSSTILRGARLLLVEDDRGVRESLARALELEGFEVSTAPDGRAALDSIATRSPDAIVLDVMMPRMSGLEVARKLRSSGDLTPILMLTARHEVARRVEGLDTGADDYLVKPFALDELLARIRALLRRGGVSGRESTLRLGELSLDPAARRVFSGAREVHLTKTEFDLLELLLFNARGRPTAACDHGSDLGI